MLAAISLGVLLPTTNGLPNAPKGKSLEEVASFPVLTTRQAMPEPERELTAGELFDGNISRLGRVEHDLPFDGNGN